MAGGLMAPCEALLKEVSICGDEATLERLTIFGTTSTFLYVIVHSISSPANTVGSLKWTKTRMFDGAVDIVSQESRGARLHYNNRFDSSAV